MNKLMTLEEAADCVPSNGMLALGGMTIYRRPMAFVFALLRRCLVSIDRNGGMLPNHLTLMSFTASLESDLLVGSGMVSRVRTCYFGMEIFGLAPMFTDFANRGKLEVMEETEASLSFGLRAQIAGIGFMPGRGWLGTDLPRLRPDVKTIVDPYQGETLMAFPAIHPDVAVIHALRADVEGNAQIGENKAVDEELALASKIVIVTSEEIVPELKKADLVAPLVQGVVLAPRGAAPTSCHPLYPVDGDALLDYTDQVSNEQTYWQYIRSWLSRGKDQPEST